MIAGWPVGRARPAGLTLAALAGLLAVNGSAIPAVADLRFAAAFAPWDSARQQAAFAAAVGEGDEAAAARYARRALAAQPYDPRSLTYLASTQRGERGIAMLNRAAALGWRDGITNLTLLQTALRENDPQSAAQRLDALARTGQAEPMFPVADQLLLMPGGVEAMAVRAAHHHGISWIPAYLATAPANAPVADARAAFVGRLDPDDGAWRRTAIGRAFDGLVKGGHVERAMAMWRATLADPALATGRIYDPAFSQFGTVDATGGEWVYPESGAALVEAAPEGGVTVTATGADNGTVLLQRIALGGPLAITAEWSGDAALLAAFDLHVLCQSGARLPLERSEGPAGATRTTTWRTVAPQGCGIGIVSLGLARPAPSGSTARIARIAGA